ncbi:hypothetical protein Ddye_029595 [Dipteronia dyeriana]|uniref:Uncharacterized protein n=1 Tax=Dipteronia dyeriana TaxID=168575 RepID=A0AAD9WLY2_9ROSI|nr:hypothetical protein Ddye_029595 [Dipteronia dyeriana]
MGDNTAANDKYEACIPGDIEKSGPDSTIYARSLGFHPHEKLQFFISNDRNPACPFPAPYRLSSSSQVTSNNRSPQHKKSSYDNQATKHHTGHAFHNSWGRRYTVTGRVLKRAMH